jgi:hypothetical protein
MLLAVVALVSAVESVATGAVLLSGATGSAASGSTVGVVVSGLVWVTGSVVVGASCALTWVVDKARTAAIAVVAKLICVFL